MARTRRSWTKAERVEMVEAYRTSGLSLDGFARQRGISPSTLWNWANGRAVLVPSARPGTPVGPVPRMVEVVPTDTTRPLPDLRCRLVLGEQAWLEVTGLPPARWVAEVATELRRC